MRHYKTYATAADNTDKTGYHKAVIQNVLANFRRARTVETDTSQVGRISRQEEVTVTRADKRH